MNRTKIELSLDARIRQLLEHYKQDDPLGIPGVPIPDPMPIPDFEGDFPAAKINLKDLKVRTMSTRLDSGLKNNESVFVLFFNSRFGLV